MTKSQIPNPKSQYYQERVERIREEIKRRKVDGLLLTHLPNIHYFASFSPQDSKLLVTPKEVILWVSKLEEEEAKLRVPFSFQVKSSPLNLSGPERIGLEAESLPYSSFIHIKENFPDIDFLPLSGLVEELRLIKDKEEIDIMRKANKQNKKILSLLKRKISPQMTERELFAKLSYLLNKKGEESFSSIVASGKRSSLPHATVSDKKIGKGVLLVDFGLSISGYKSDFTRTFTPGKIKAKKILSLLERAQKEALKEVRPGKLAKDIDRISRKVIEEEGFGKYFIHGLGHGVGLEIHEKPTISQKSNEILKEGMVFTLEPGVYIPENFGARKEDMVVVTKEGCELL